MYLGAAAPALPGEDPGRGPGQRRGLPPRRDRRTCPFRARSSTSRSRRQQSSASRATTNYVSPAGKPANLDAVVFKWYGDPDAMIAGYRNNEIDVAFDLQDSDLPKVQDLGDQVAAIPALLYEFLRPNWSPGPFNDGRRQPEHRRLLAQPGGPGPRHGLPDRRPGDPPGHRLRDRQGRDQHAAPRRQRPGREHEHQPVGLVLQGLSPGELRPGEGQADPRRRRAGPTPTATASSRRTASRPRSSCAPRPGRSARTRWPSSAHGSRTSASTACINPVDAVGHLRRLQRGDRTTPRARSRGATSTSRSTRSARRSTRSATTPATTAASSARRRERCSGQRHRLDAALDAVKNNVDFNVVKDAMATFQDLYVDKTIEIPLYYRKNVELVEPALGNYSANGTLAGSDLERRGLVRHPVGRAFELEANRAGRPECGRPVRLPARMTTVGVLSAQRPFAAGSTARTGPSTASSGLRPNADDQVHHPTRDPGDPRPVRDHDRRLRHPARRSRRADGQVRQQPAR